MRYLPLVWAALRRRPIRSLLTFLSILVAFILFAILGGISGGLAHVAAVSRLDRLNTSSRFGGSLPYADIAKIAQVPGVTIVAPVVGVRGYYRDPKNEVIVAMVTPDFFKAHDEFTITKQQLAAFKGNAIVVGVGRARIHGWKVGDRITITSATLSKTDGRNWTFNIIAVVENQDFADFPIIMGNYDYFDKSRAAGAGTIDSAVERTNDPVHDAQISHAIDDLFANSPAPTHTMSEKVSAQSGVQALGDVNVLTRAVTGAVLFMLLFVTGNTMMQSVRERTSEFAVMRTLGFPDNTTLALIFAESFCLCALAGACGLLIVKLGFPLLQNALPVGVPSIVVFSWSGIVTGFAFALTLALLSALIPALRVRRMNVVDALAGR